MYPAVLLVERFSHVLYTTMHIIGKDLPIMKDALPSPNTLLSGKVYYGLKRSVVKFLTLKEYTIPASPTKAGLALPTLKNHLEEKK